MRWNSRDAAHALPAFTESLMHHHDIRACGHACLHSACRLPASRPLLLADGSEMLFGVPSPTKADSDLQIVQWRLCTNVPTNDPNAFTIDGSVPLPTPRKDPRRRMTADIVPQAIPGDVLGREAIWNDLRRAEANAEDAATPSPREHERRRAEGGSRWRQGDSTQLSFDGNAVSQRAPGNPTLDSRWRKGDSLQFTFDGSALEPRAPNPLRNATWRVDPWKD